MRDEFDHVLVHTGQHYDDSMSRIFFEQLGVGAPDYLLEVGSGSHAVQTARVMERLEPLLIELSARRRARPGRRQLDDGGGARGRQARASRRPCRGGTAELRPHDARGDQPLVADSVADLLFIHSPEARNEPARARERRRSRSSPVGNTMIDTLVGDAVHGSTQASTAASLGLDEQDYLLVTLHRPALIDGPLLAEAMASCVTSPASCRSCSPSIPGPARESKPSSSTPSGSRCSIPSATSSS